MQVLDPQNAPTLLVDEFTLLCEILASGVLQQPAWFASRLVSLWFGHGSVTGSIFSKFRIPLATSTCLLPFFYQIAGRLGTPDVNKFVIECATRHPQVCLPPILQLRMGAKGCVGGRAEAERAKHAELVVEKLLISGTAKDTLLCMQAAFKFYLNLAMTKVTAPQTVSSTRTGGVKSVAEISGFSDFAKLIPAGHAFVLTATTCTLQSIDPEYAIAESGKSLPKILKLVDTAGKVHRQIVKGNDDLRNDAVLQQLFALLKVRSYKVVPISAGAGIAEWVSGTVTVGSYLVGYPNEAAGAHVRCHPTDLEPAQVKAKMVHARQQSRGAVDSLQTTYANVCKKFQPCMHFFFYENFFTPKTYFQAQTAYANSVAATSVVGFVVGLGDRHPNNILLDLTSGEVIHIDYGICFDAGRFLKVPEIVPFRLTRDMVAGLGVLGTQGPFAKACEDVLVSLKKNSALVIAVVEVFVVDPLFNWAVASLGSDNAQAALLGVKRKLQGFLDDALPLTPSAQVDRLIRSATDPRNLCQMFAGWQPWV